MMFEQLVNLIFENAKKIIEVFEILDMIPTVFEEITKHIVINRDGLNEQGEVIKENRDEILEMQKVIGRLIIRINELEQRDECDSTDQVGG